MRFFLTTFGCKVNQYEAQVILEQWAGQGHVQVAEAAQAEVVLIHSCAVTAKAVADLRKAAAALHRNAPGAGIMITGCAAQTFDAELRDLPGVVGVFGTQDRGRLLQGPDVLLERPGAFPGGLPGAIDTFPRKPSALPPHGPRLMPQASTPPRMLAGVSDFRRARAQVKIQDGCSHGCTYCIVPLARGPGQSREPREIVAEVKRLLAAGFREVSLIGINLRLYGQDLQPRCDFWKLVQTLEQTFAPEWAGRARFRLSSLDPAMLGTKALEVIVGSRMVCPHLHLSLQSASPAVLADMGRGHYHPESVLDFCARLERRLGHYALGADLLTGFPGETDAHFLETLDFCTVLPLTYAHVFPFSPRPGTPAADHAEQVPEDVRRDRAKRLRALAGTKRRRFWKTLAQHGELTMVMEGTDPVQGKCEYYVPCRLESAPGDFRVRGLLRVRPLGVGPKGLECVPAEAGFIPAGS